MFRLAASQAFASVRRRVSTVVLAGLVLGALVGLAVPQSALAHGNTATATDIANPDGYSCSETGFVEFESLPDGTTLPGTIDGLDFVTTGGHTWLVGDFASGNYNGKYPNGAYTSEGTHWAWLGTDQGSGRIDMSNGSASYFSLLTSVGSTSVYLDAYDAAGDLLAEAGPAPADISTGHMTELTITRASRDISYVIVHDTGNFFLADSLCTDAPGVVEPAAGLVLGVGDSVPAGYGLGSSAGAPDNTSAYPYRLGNTLGLPATDYAVAGACAVRTGGACAQTSVLNQIDDAQTAGLHPSVITLQVGADDLAFQDCLEGYLTAAIGLGGQACSTATIAANLNQFQTGLAANVSEIQRLFPAADLALVQYYNPFPSPVSSFDQSCPLYEALPSAGAFVQLINQYGFLGGVNAALGLLTSPVAFQNTVVQDQGLVFAYVQDVLDDLNAIIAQTSGKYHTLLVSPIDFVGHDFCASELGKTPYVFGPDISASGSLGSLGVSYSTPGPRCSPNFADLDPPPQNRSGSASSPLGQLAVNVHSSANCLPHPTSDGQQAIAKDVFAVINGTLLPPTATGQKNVPGGTAVTSIQAPSGQIIIVTGDGTGQVFLGLYASNPIPGGVSGTFSSAGVYFDVSVNGPNEGGPGNQFSRVTVKDCDLNGGATVEWWNPTGGATGQGAWQPVSNETAPSGSPPCITITVDNTTSPNLSQLAGTVFAVALPQSTSTTVASNPDPSVIGGPVTYTATIAPAPTGGTVAFRDNGAPVQGCETQPVNSMSGRASCTIAYTHEGVHAIVAIYSGTTGFYGSGSPPLAIGSTATTLEQSVVPPPPLAQGSFVIGDQNAAIGSAVTFWGAQWSALNSLSGGKPPSSFKGFASNLSDNPPKCGDHWASQPGTSSSPPATLPRYMAVIASSTITKSGSTISGNTPEIVVVRTNSRYAPEPGQPGAGTVVGIVCGG